LGHRTRARGRAANDLVGRERVLAAGSVLDPVAQRLDVVVGVEARDALDLLEHVANVRVEIRGEALGRLELAEVVALDGGRVRGPHDHAVLVDPERGRDVDDAEQLVQLVRGVDELRMLGAGALDPRTGGVDLEIESDGDDLETSGAELSPQLPPHGQRHAASSPRRPRGYAHLLAAQRGEIERPSLDVLEDDRRQLGRGEHVVAGIGTEGPHAVSLVVDERHPEAVGNHRHVESTVGAGVRRNRDAPLVLAQAFGLELPAGPALQLLWCHVELLEDHACTLARRATFPGVRDEGGSAWSWDRRSTSSPATGGRTCSGGRTSSSASPGSVSCTSSTSSRCPHTPRWRGRPATTPSTSSRRGRCGGSGGRLPPPWSAAWRCCSETRRRCTRATSSSQRREWRSTPAFCWR